MNEIGTIIAPELPNSVPRNAQWLSGQGKGTWFSIEATSNTNQYKIKRFRAAGELDCDRIFEIEANGSVFDINETFEFTYVSHCAKCRIMQNGKVFVFNYIKNK